GTLVSDLAPAKPEPVRPARPRAATRQLWVERLDRFARSGLAPTQFCAADNNLSERTLRAIALGRNNWGVLGSAAGGQTAAVLYTVVGTCKHLGIDPFTYLCEALPGLFALGEKPQAEALQEWLPDRWLLRRRRDAPGGPAA